MLPYAKIPPYPESVTAGNLMGRQIDGAAFRFYWATEDLEGIDLQYRPSIEAMSLLETVQHIHSLSTTIRNTILEKVNEKEINIKRSGRGSDTGDDVNHIYD